MDSSYGISARGVAGADVVEWSVSTRNPLRYRTSIVYDAVGRVVATIDPLSYRTTSVYNAAGETIASVDAQGYRASTTYDAAGQAIATIDPLAARTTSVYDLAGRSIASVNPLGRRSTTVYDKAGRSIAAIDPLAHRATTVYDPAGRAIVEINANGGRQTTTYDAAGRRIGLRDPRGYRMSFTYDAAGQTTSEVNAVGSRTTFTYDANSQRVGRLDPRGIPTTWTYDAANRMRSRRQPGGQIVTWTHDPAGNLVQLETPLGRYTRTFDPADNVLFMTTPEDQTLQWVRDPLGRRKVLIDPDGGRTTYTCNGLGQVTKLVNAHLERTTTVYDPAGRETRLELDNGTVTTTIYDAAGQTIRVAHVGFENFDYGYDLAGRRVRLVESTGDRVTWTYDPTGQLVGEARSGANAYATTYVYDPSGNRLVEITETNRTTSVYDGFNRLLKSDSLSGITTYSYDPAGNRTRLEDPSGDLTTYTWNAENHLVQTELPSGDVVTTLWDPINKNAEERIVRRDDGTTTTHYLWDNNNILRETDDVGATEAEYTYIPQPYGDLVSQRREAESSFYQFDALGSTTGLTDETGAVTDEYRYKAFGETVAETGATDNPYQWVAREGYRKDKATGLLNLRGREVDPETAQFTSADPKGLDAGDSNFYRYVGNDPVRRSDPSGLSDVYYANGGVQVGTYCPTDRSLVGRVVNGVLLWMQFDDLQQWQMTGNHNKFFLLSNGAIDWDKVFETLGDPSESACPSAPRPKPKVVAASQTCSANRGCQKDYFTVEIPSSLCEAGLGAQPTVIRIYYERETGGDWDIQRLALEVAAAKLRGQKSLPAIRQSLAEGIVVGEFVVRATLDAADTADALICFGEDLSFRAAGNVALAALPFVAARMSKASDDFGSGGGAGRAPDSMTSPRFGKYVRRVDDFKHALDPDHVKAALREKNGQITGINPKTGRPWDHLKETRNAMHGALDRIILLKKYLSDRNLSPQLRCAVESELGELSQLLDNAEKILGELAK